MIREQDDFIWIPSEGGVNAVLKKLPNDICDITYRIHQIYDAATTTPAKRAIKAFPEQEKGKAKKK